MINCSVQKACMRLYQNTGKIKLSGVYHALIGRRDGQRVWIVDGDRVSRDLYPEWIMGGNDQRYRFNPAEEFWIDDRIGSEELEYTIAHEVLERKLMISEGMTYSKAHNKALELEGVLRAADKKRSNRAGDRLIKLVEGGALDTRAARLGEDDMKRMHRIYCGRAHGASLWIVDGPLVRASLDPNFCFGDNGLMSGFIPRDEIWLDSSMSARETYFAMLRQKVEYKHLASGSKQSRAYDLALAAQLDERDRQANIARAYEEHLAAVRFGTRERGVKKK